MLITQKHLSILWLSRSWSYLISRLWSRFPLVISNQNLSGYCLPEEAKPPVSFLCDHAIITGIVAVWNVIPVNHTFDTKYFQSHIFQIHQLIVHNQDLESAKLKIKNNPLLVGSLETKSSFKETSRPTDERHVSLWRIKSVSSVSKVFISCNCIEFHQFIALMIIYCIEFH